MNITGFNPVIKKAVRMVNKGELDLNYYIQRPSDQWNKKQKSLLIHSVIKGFPIPELFTMKDKETEEVFVLDGKQRLTVLRQFVQNEFAIDEELDLCHFEGEEIHIGGMLFDEMSEEIQDQILGYQLSIRQIEGAEEYEINEMFYALNNGKPLNRTQKARSYMVKDWVMKMKELKEHPFIVENAYFTANQLKNNDDENLLLQFMILERYADDEMRNFSAYNIAEYGKNLQQDEELNQQYLEELYETLDYLKSAYGEDRDSVILKKANIPYVLNVANYVRKKGTVHPKLFKESMDGFKTAIVEKLENKTGIETNYNDFARIHTTDKVNVVGKRRAIREYVDAFIEKNDAYKELASEKIN